MDTDWDLYVLENFKPANDWKKQQRELRKHKINSAIRFLYDVTVLNISTTI